MRLIVKKPNTRYAGVTYAVGETFEVDPLGHNVASQIRFLKAVGRVEDGPPPAPVGHVATTAPAPTFEEAPAAEPAPTPEPEAAPEAPVRRGRYARRDMRSDEG